MADVDMPDAGSAAPAKSKATGKAKTGLGEGNSDGKKRFEVKKVLRISVHKHNANMKQVERCCSVGLGYRGRQLCHLQKPHYGSLWVHLTLIETFRS